MTLWEVDVHPAAGQPDLLARAVISEAADLGLGDFSVHAARGFLVQGEISPKQIEQIAVPESWTANVCFGGADHKTLFVTASASLYSMKMKVQGAARQ